MARKAASVRSDNGPEFQSGVVQAFAKDNDIEWQFIEPGSPAQNSYIERFNGTYRDEVLDAFRFETLSQARAITEDWMRVYNEQRVHQSIGNLPPKVFKQRGRINSLYC